MWGTVQRFGILAVGVLALWGATILGLNLTVLSPGGYVLSYLRALEHGNVRGAAEMAGVTSLAALPRVEFAPQQPRIIGVDELSTGHLLVAAEYFMGSTRHQTSFTLKRQPAEWGLFRRWTFLDLPVAVVQVGVEGGNAVSVNGTRVAEGADGQSDATVLVPGIYRLEWFSPWIESETVTVAMDRVGETTALSLTARPTAAFREEADKAVAEYLEGCTNQGVLQPAGCPFGVEVVDRVTGEIDWRITTAPRVSLSLGSDDSVWVATARGGEATVDVDLRSLFDGSISSYTETLTFDLVGTVEGVWSGRPTLRID